MAAGLGFLGAQAPSGGLLRRSVIDPVTGNPLITSAPTGEVRQRGELLPIGRDDDGRLVPAVPGGVFSAIDAARYAGQVLRGEKGVFDPATGHVSDEAMGAANGMAGLAMTGSMPFKAPAGAIRSFGGGQSLDELLASMEATIAEHAKTAVPDRPHTMVDPSAKSWDLFHGTSAGEDFAKFRVDLPWERGKTSAQPSEAGALFLSPAPAEAAYYAGDVLTDPYKGPAGPRLIRATVDPGKTDVLDIPHMVMNDQGFVDRARNAYLSDAGDTPMNRRMFDNHIERTRDGLRQHNEINQQIREMGHEEAPPYVPYAYSMAGAAVQMAKERGLDTAVIRGLSESNGGDQVVALTPGRVRSHYDPDHVLYSGGAGGAVPSFVGLLGADPAQQPGLL